MNITLNLQSLSI